MLLSRSVCPLSKSAILPAYKQFSSHTIASAVFNTFDFPASCIESILLTSHNALHLPWWSVIVATTLTLRAITTLPIQIYIQKRTAEVEIAHSEITEFSGPLMSKIMTQCKRDNLTIEEANKKVKIAYNQLRHDKLAQHNINLKIYRLQSFILPFFQLPLFISISIAVRNLTGALPDWYKSTSPLPSMRSEGVAWFQDLTIPDPYFVIPVVFLISNLVNISVYSNQMRQQSTALKIVNNTFRSLSIAMAYVSTQMPAGLTLYWMVSACYGLGQNVVLKLPKFRRVFRIPKTNYESEHPIRSLANKYKSKWTEFVKFQKQYQETR